MAVRTARQPSFLSGMARAFDPGAVLRVRPARRAAAADMMAMRSDWEAVGECLRQALDMQWAQLDEAQTRAVSDRCAELTADGKARADGGGDAGQP